MSLIHNERIKLLATMVNNVGTATIVAGAVTPLVAVTYSVSGSRSAWFTFFLSLGWFSVGFGLHFLARAILGRLKE